MKTGDKWTAVRCLLNLIIKDELVYCNTCGKPYDSKNPWCCDDPQVGRHINHLRAIVKQNKEHKELMMNDYGMTEKKSMRWGVSLPPYIFHVLNKTFKKTYNEDLFRDGKDLHGFMKAFPAFTVCNKV